MNKEFICTTCGSIIEPKKTLKGGLGTEVASWLLFPPIGLGYSIWRGASRIDVCPKCKSKSIIPTDTPAGQKLREEQRMQEAKKGNSN